LNSPGLPDASYCPAPRPVAANAGSAAGETDSPLSDTSWSELELDSAGVIAVGLVVPVEVENCACAVPNEKAIAADSNEACRKSDMERGNSMSLPHELKDELAGRHSFPIEDLDTIVGEKLHVAETGRAGGDLRPFVIFARLELLIPGYRIVRGGASRRS
jgi:hypothetical protein